MRAAGLLVLAFVTGGCGGCQRAEEGAQHRDVPAAVRRPAVQLPAATAGKIQAGGVQPRAGLGDAPVPPGGAPEGRPAEPPPEEAGDCIVVVDANPDYGPPPLGVSFSAEAECSAGQPVFKWSFGDGSPPSSEMNPAHTYTRVGEYTASVTVTGPDGATASDEIDITVEEGEAELE